jgi:DNA-binding transcriptional MerR regulator
VRTPLNIGLTITPVAGRRWSIGEVARASGLTVRTLHHYDEIGLVIAGERTASGHRRYTEADLRRLYRVRALRGLGLSLEEIAMVLHRSTEDDLATLRELLTAQLHELEAHAQRITHLRHHIGGLLAQLTDSTMPNPDQFMMALELAGVAEAYFSQEQRDFLLDCGDGWCGAPAEATRTEALALLKEIRLHQLDGTPVDDPRVQALTRRVDDIGTSVHGGDERLISTANRMWRDNRIEISRSLDLPAADEVPDIVDYLRQARQARRTT